MQVSKKFFSVLGLLFFVINVSAQSNGKAGIVSDAKSGYIAEAAPEGGLVQVNAATKTVLPGTTFDAPVGTSSISGQNAISYQFDLLYDASVFTYNSCSVAGTMSAGRVATCNLTGPGAGGAGRLTVVVFGSTPLVDTSPIGGILINLNFTAIGNLGDSSLLTFRDFFFNEGSPASVAIGGVLSIGSSTAAGASISGQVVSASGSGIANARLALRDGEGNVKNALTNAFGYYRFYDVPTGSTYVISVVSKRYTFAAQTVNLGDELVNLNFVADQ